MCPGEGHVTTDEGPHIAEHHTLAQYCTRYNSSVLRRGGHVTGEGGGGGTLCVLTKGRAG
eukprot:3940407-Rhodomonas_salina.2